MKTDCVKSCGLCPAPDGAISSDAYTGPNGHYYLGSNRRRIGAGFGRRRQTPVPETTNSTAPKKVTETIQVPVDILHPEGTATVVKDEEAISAVPCAVCVKTFRASGGCVMWKNGGSPVLLAKAAGCEHCADEAAQACGMVKETEGVVDETALLKPLEHPAAAAAAEQAAASDAKAEADADTPSAIIKAVEAAEPTEPIVPIVPVAKPEAVAQTPSSPETVAQAQNSQVIADAKTSADEEVAAAEQYQAAEKQTAAATAISKAAAATGTKSETVANSKADIAKAEAEAAEQTADQTQGTAAASAAAGAAAKAHTAAVTATVETPAPSAEPVVPPTETEIINNQASSWAQGEMNKQQAATSGSSASVDEVIPERV